MITNLIKSKTLTKSITFSFLHLKNQNLPQSHDQPTQFHQTRSMGGPSSHLKQLKGNIPYPSLYIAINSGLVKKVHKVLPLEHPKTIDAMTHYLADELTFQMKHKKQQKVPECDPNANYCAGGKIFPWCSFPIVFPPKKWKTV